MGIKCKLSVYICPVSKELSHHRMARVVDNHIGLDENDFDFIGLCGRRV